MQSDGTAEVLLVEDDEDHAFLVCRALEECGAPNHCVVVRNGVEALSHVRNGGGTPDLILMDLNMPLKDGRATLAELKQDPVLRRIPVVILTTSEYSRDVAQCYERGAASYLVKPIDLEELFVAISATMR